MAENWQQRIANYLSCVKVTYAFWEIDLWLYGITAISLNQMLAGRRGQRTDELQSYKDPRKVKGMAK